MTLDEVYFCQLGSSLMIPPYLASSILLAAEKISDPYGLGLAPSNFTSQFVIIPSNFTSNFTPDCFQTLNGLYEDPEQPYVTYSSSFNYQTPSTVNACSSPPCNETYIALEFGSNIIRTSTSIPGISQLDIWLNVGSIVGAVQFFMWLLTLVYG